MRMMGVADELISTLLITNPARMLSLSV
jgi:predicted metal-dependent phosphotriesterase family hydrolase